MHTVMLKVSVTVTTLHQQSPLVQCTANSSAEASPSRRSVGFIYKWAHRRANDSFNACGEQITVQKDWLQLSSWALIQCHRNKVILLHSEIKSHFFTLSASAHGEVCPYLIGSGICCESWKIWQPAEDNGLNSCSKSKADPANSPYVQFCAEVSLLSCWTTLFKPPIRIPDSPQPNTVRPPTCSLSGEERLHHITLRRVHL